MSTGDVSSKAADFLEKRFSHFKPLQKLSRFSDTHLILADKSEYVVKIILYKNFGSVILHDKEHVKKLLKVVSAINQTDDIKTVSVVDFSTDDESSVLLFKKENISTLLFEKISDFIKLGKTIQSFHSVSNHIKFQELSWHDFPENYVTELKKSKRWSVVAKFLADYKDYDRRDTLVTCHNDIHAGNIFIAEGKVIFLDIDDMCHGSYYNDLGMIIANFTTSDYSKKEMRQTIVALMTGYCNKCTENDIVNIILYAIRKLYFTEGYYLFCKKMTGEPVVFVDELHKRQALLNNLLCDYRLDTKYKY